MLAVVTFDKNMVDARGGPGESDWTSGLKYDLRGKVVSAVEVTTEEGGCDQRPPVLRMIRAGQARERRLTSSIFISRSNSRKRTAVGTLCAFCTLPRQN